MTVTSHTWHKLYHGYLIFADDYSGQQRAPGQISHELQSVLSYANVPLSQSAAYSSGSNNGNVYNTTNTSAYVNPGQPVQAASGYASAMAAGPAAQMYSGKSF